MISEIVHIDFLERLDFKDFLISVSKENESVLGYHFPFYLQMLENTGVGRFYGVILKDDKTEQIFGFVPGFLKSSEIGSVYSSMPFFGPNAGLLMSRNRSDYFEAFSEALNCLENSWDSAAMISASFYTPFNHEGLMMDYQRALPEALRVDKFTSYIKLDELQLSTSLQYDIRKALKSGVEIKSVNDAESARAIYDIYIQNCTDYGIPPKSKECIDLLVSQSSASGNTESYIALVDGKVIGGLIMVYSEKTASYYLPCSIHEYRSYQPTTLLIKHSMDLCIERGLTHWNWESSPSKDSGVFKFKQKWGSQEGQYQVLIKAYKEESFFRELGASKIASYFPHFFVFPFNLLS